MIRYKDYEITKTPNEWGYYEASSLVDCDALMLNDKTLTGLKIQIDELNDTTI